MTAPGVARWIRESSGDLRAPPQQRQEDPAAVQDPPQVDVEHPLPALRGDLREVATCLDTRVVAQDVHPAERLQRRVRDLRLGELGVHGNGHLMMIERNNAEVLDVVLGWLAHNLRR
jgi:hypothetical protein